ncbi:hypothetical protein [Rariglobus hedericola]|uniref:PEP-CTERM sorting domain-containing protein n=1 Tax=Rariglobus hedericola TaxID=2597822 RepID=A0A556QLF0_9BACT|nr:hypothetical protein [Rariglobus hedericola]TSJ77477.1 hypothetical protein FPL22_15430 [Rariglobus hedericola]
MKPRLTSRAASLVSLLAIALGLPLVHATPLQVTDIGLSGSFTAGSPEIITGNATVTTLTTSEGTFSGLLGAVANNVTAVNNTPYSIGTAPTDSNAAASGLTVNDAVNNMNSGRFQFTGLTLNASTRFFVLETTPTTTYGDPFTVTLINASNVQVGSFTLSLLAANFTQTSLANVDYNTGTGTLTGGKLSGVSFSFTDLGVTDFGAIASVTGISINGGGLLDPSVVGAYSVIPEPGSFGVLAGLAAFAALVMRRRRS